ncbi:MAG: lactoylglutathione lyase [Bacteriovoracaceae bacterium]|jgi:lactoylglutathione lyase
MIRVENLETTLDFFVGKLGFVQISRQDYEKGRFSLIFLAAPKDADQAREKKAPVIELTYNWPSDDEESEKLSSGRNFGHLAFRVDDIYKTCQDLMDKGVVINRPPRDGYMAFIKSPDNISIELLQSGERLEVTEPWKSMENIGSW